MRSQTQTHTQTQTTYVCSVSFVQNSVRRTDRHMWAHLYENEETTEKKNSFSHLILLIRTPNSPQTHTHTHKHTPIVATINNNNKNQTIKSVHVVRKFRQTHQNNNNNSNGATATTTAIKYMKGEEKIVVIKAIYTNNTCYYEQY